MRSGIILLDKRAGVSSARAIAEVKRACAVERIGHAGTLDPFATGLLVCLAGRATRVASYAQHGTKEYRGRARFGIATDTDDITGRITREDSALPSPEEILATRERFIGEISQVPPQISAIKVGGERAYRRARAGEEVTLAPRTVRVERFEIGWKEGSEYEFVVRCSSGTYIRSLLRDLGAAVGSCAVVTSLRRTYSAPFSIEQAHTIEEMTPGAVTALGALFPDAPSILVTELEHRALQGGDERVVRRISEKISPSDPPIVLVHAPQGGEEKAEVGVLSKGAKGLGIVAVW